MSSEFVEPTNEFLGNRDWGQSIAATLNMKQGIKVAGDNGDFYIPLTEERINQNLRHFFNLLNQECFGPNWRRKGKRLNVLSVWERGARDHIHLRIRLPFAPPTPPTTFDELKNDSSEILVFRRLILACWENTDFGHGKNHISIFCDDRWNDYLTKRKTKGDYGLSFLWENTYLPAKASPLPAKAL